MEIRSAIHCAGKRCRVRQARYVVRVLDVGVVWLGYFCEPCMKRLIARKVFRKDQFEFTTMYQWKNKAKNRLIPGQSSGMS